MEIIFERVLLALRKTTRNSPSKISILEILTESHFYNPFNLCDRIVVLQIKFVVNSLV